ncbi:hypothetical protein WDZ16_15400 [Pseudokineococcus marinus]|uniref:hypothetical protein n=1 Tax=Pseudokineococcus marinus TaxID=351215 RepID=UPI0030B3565A
MTDVDVRADGEGAYLVAVSAGAGADALAEPGEPGAGDRRVRLLLPEELLERLDLRAADGPVLARAAADVLVEDGTWRALADEVSLAELDRERPGFLERVREVSGR